MASLTQVAPGTWLDADEVVAVTSEGQIAVVHLGGGSRVLVALSADQVAHRINQTRTAPQQQQQQAQRTTPSVFDFTTGR